MSDRGGTAEQPSIPEPVNLGPEHIWLGIAIAAFAVALGTYTIDTTIDPVELNRGAYAILVAVFVGGLINWRIGAAERRVRIEFGSVDRAELRDTLIALRDQVDRLATKVEELAERRYEDGHADGFVDGAVASEPPVRLVKGVGHTRRLRPRLTSDS